MSDLQAGEICLVRIKNRPTYLGRELKPFAKELDGRELEVQVMWKMGDDDLYPGEFALWPTRRADKAAIWAEGKGITWIASGDVEIIARFKSD